MTFSGYVNDGRTTPGLDRTDEITIGTFSLTGDSASGTVTWSFTGDYSERPEVFPGTPIWVCGTDVPYNNALAHPRAVSILSGNISTTGASGIVFLGGKLSGASSGVKYDIPLRVVGKSNP